MKRGVKCQIINFQRDGQHMHRFIRNALLRGGEGKRGGVGSCPSRVLLYADCCCDVCVATFISRTTNLRLISGRNGSLFHSSGSLHQIILPRDNEIITDPESIP
ncbi:hypothetical protein CEXT_560981 [Caerostris extrusa]|uniref:Uncharacterized protein n=1 Tax=Caerostris extrusa TaxID=172846 RepID=A0AAV4NNV7_CAEEX|nr:hypothetical protein CEXT_560981 [Caerostris extrusa]